MHLVYHPVQSLQHISPFDVAIKELATRSHLKIACPYISINYLQKITDLSASWILLTDVTELLAILSNKDRQIACRFIAKHRNQIRHIPRLHAKVFLGDKSALIGSANLTVEGLLRRTEMAISISQSDQALFNKLNSWFEALWNAGNLVPDIEELRSSILDLPSLQVIQSIIPASQNLFNFEASEKPATFEERSGSRTVYQYKGRYHDAHGYYRQSYYNDNHFCVLKGSTARGKEASNFKSSYPSCFDTRQRLISSGVMKKEANASKYVFTRDYSFSSISEAAGVVFGGSRSGPKEWKIIHPSAT